MVYFTLSQTWKTFLTNHTKQFAAVDLFTVSTITFPILKPVVLEQCKKVKAVKEYASLNDAARAEKLRAVNREANQQMKAILTPEQWAKFVEARRVRAEKNKTAPEKNPDYRRDA
jgi:hypothetical protein